MKSIDLKPIIHNLNSHIVNILVKLEPELKNHYWAKNPCFQGIRFLIEKALPLLNRAGETEIKQLNELAKNAKNYFKLQINSKIFATCHVFLNSATVDNVEYSFDFDQIIDYFGKVYTQVGIKANFTEAYPFQYIMTDQQIDGFTKHTYLRFAAERKSNGEIIIYEQPNPSPNDPDLLADLDNEISFGRKEIIDATKNEWGRDKLYEKTRVIKKEFEEYATEVKMEYQLLIDTFETLVNILNSEIEIRKISRPASFIHLPFDKKKNQEIIELLFNELNGRCFNTSKENFTKIFYSDNTFIKIDWLWTPNALVQLFTGFTFDFDGIQLEFPDLMYGNNNKWIILADKFNFEFNGKITSPAKHLEKLKRRHQRPNQFKNILPIFKAIKKGWNK
jgi:hypothetical protein